MTPTDSDDGTTGPQRPRAAGPLGVGGLGGPSGDVPVPADGPVAPPDDRESVVRDADDLPTDPAAVLALIEEQRRSVRQGIEPHGSLLFGIWGGAWLVGYLTLYLGYDADLGRAQAWAFIIFGACLVAAMIMTAVHIARRVAGIRGRSAAAGAMYGWAWPVCFLMAFLVFAGLVRVGATPEVMAIATNSISCLVVAALYMAGGALCQEWRMFALGAWVALIGGAAALVTQPAMYLVMSLAGGGGFLLAALADTVRTRRRSAGEHASA